MKVHVLYFLNTQRVILFLLVYVNEILFMVLKFSISNHLSVTAMTDLLRLINNIFRTLVFPASKYFIDKLLNPVVGVTFHAVCNTCSAYIGEFADVQKINSCTICNSDVNLTKSSNTSFFYTYRSLYTYK